MTTFLHLKLESACFKGVLQLDQTYQMDPHGSTHTSRGLPTHPNKTEFRLGDCTAERSLGRSKSASPLVSCGAEGKASAGILPSGSPLSFLTGGDREHGTASRWRNGPKPVSVRVLGLSADPFGVGCSTYP